MIGQYRHSLDNKGRLFIPARLREELGETLYVAKGADNCISVYSEEGWAKITEKLSSLPYSKTRRITRELYAYAGKCEPDAQGRILLPQQLRDYALLQKNAVIIGVADHAEIWDEAAWDAMESEGLSGEELLEAMEELGL